MKNRDEVPGVALPDSSPGFVTQRDFSNLKQLSVSFCLRTKTQLAMPTATRMLAAIAECMAGKTGRSEDRRLHQGCRAFTSGLRTFEDVLEVMASKRTSPALRHLQWNAVGSELVAETKVQTFVSVARHSGAPRQWLPRLPSCECNSDEQFRSIAEIASTETRSRRRIAGHGDNLYSCD
jgi:hypothetical protein